MKKNLAALGGLVHSEDVLLALAQKGLAREEAYRLVQRNAMKVWEKNGDFRALIEADAEIGKLLSKPEIAVCFDLGRHLQQVDLIFERVFGRA
jgi:adenylosuccinate lyase